MGKISKLEIELIQSKILKDKSIDKIETPDDFKTFISVIKKYRFIHIYDLINKQDILREKNAILLRKINYIHKNESDKLKFVTYNIENEFFENGISFVFDNLEINTLSIENLEENIFEDDISKFIVLGEFIVSGSTMPLKYTLDDMDLGINIDYEYLEYFNNNYKIEMEKREDLYDIFAKCYFPKISKDNLIEICTDVIDKFDYLTCFKVDKTKNKTNIIWSNSNIEKITGDINNLNILKENDNNLEQITIFNKNLAEDIFLLYSKYPGHFNIIQIENIFLVFHKNIFKFLNLFLKDGYVFIEMLIGNLLIVNNSAVMKLDYQNNSVDNEFKNNKYNFYFEDYGQLFNSDFDIEFKDFLNRLTAFLENKLHINKDKKKKIINYILPQSEEILLVQTNENEYVLDVYQKDKFTLFERIQENLTSILSNETEDIKYFFNTELNNIKRIENILIGYF